VDSNVVYKFYCQNCILRTGTRNVRRVFCSINHCIAILMQAHTNWTQFDKSSLFGKTRQCSFQIGGRQRGKKRSNCNRRAICSITHGTDAGHRVSQHCSVSDGSDRVHLLRQSHPANTDFFFWF
jgi:hypothetical protein